MRLQNGLKSPKAKYCYKIMNSLKTLQAFAKLFIGVMSYKWRYTQCAGEGLRPEKRRLHQIEHGIFPFGSQTLTSTLRITPLITYNSSLITDKKSPPPLSGERPSQKPIYLLSKTMICRIKGFS
jgi:hypothetical protein